MLPVDQVDAFKDSLCAGHYNLLLGSGTSLDSINASGDRLRGVFDLTQRLCQVTGIASGTTLQRVASLLTPTQRQAELVDHYTCAEPGSSLARLPRFLWRRAFTFNIDDVIEVVYQRNGTPKQGIEPLTYDAPFAPTPTRDNLQVVHLHGYVRLPDTPFVFSLGEYARLIQDANPWVSLLANILATEPFIVAGTSLNEVDVQAFLRPRANPTPLRRRGPSILIEPNPDRVTQSDCARLGLTLVDATVEEFFDWLATAIPAPPSVAELMIPDRAALLVDSMAPHRRLRLFTDFRLVSGADAPRPLTASGFLYGREPSWADIQSHLDVERRANVDVVRATSDGATDHDARIICITDDEAMGGTGKTTILKRVGHDLASRGELVFYRYGELRGDSQVAAECIRACPRRPILLYDNLADHAEEVAEIVELANRPFVVLGTERTYRLQHLRNVLGTAQWQPLVARKPSATEYRNLIAQYAQFGLLAFNDFVRTPDQAIRRIESDPFAIAVCRLLNDFRPLDVIASSMWSHAAGAHRLPYLIAALAHHCHSTGVRLELLQAAVPGTNIAPMFDDDCPLSLDLHPDLDDFVVPTNQTLAEAFLRHASGQSLDQLRDAFTRLAATLAPFVNRAAIVRRTSEALIARRLFDVDRVTRPLLRNQAELFYADAQPNWRWNSRYWEQCALLAAEGDLGTAIRHARHAVAIERHPYPLTTLGKLLLRKVEETQPHDSKLFNEAFLLLTDAIRLEYHNSRVAVHPYVTLLTGAARYVEGGGQLSSVQAEQLSGIVGDVQHRFRRDTVALQAADRLERAL